MADIKFECPECKQRIAVDQLAGGLHIDCPTCRSSLVIPGQTGVAPEVLVRRKLAVLAGTMDGVYEGLERHQQEVSKVREEAAGLREASKRSLHELEEARKELARLRSTEAHAEDASPSRGDGENPATGSPEYFELESKLARLQAELIVVTAERDELQDANDHRAADLRSLLDGARAEVEAVSPAQEKIAALETERDNVRAQLNEVRILLADSASWKIQADAAVAEAAKLRDDLAAITAERDRLHGDLARTRAELDSLHRLLAAAELSSLSSAPGRLDPVRKPVEVSAAPREERSN